MKIITPMPCARAAAPICGRLSRPALPVLTGAAAVTAALFAPFERPGATAAGVAAAGTAAFAAPKISAAARRGSGASASSGGPAGTLVYRGGVVHTMNRAAPSAEAVAISGGRILAVGTEQEVGRAVSSSAKIIDLQGKTLMPGFIDGHGHIGITALTRAFQNLAPPPAGPVRSIADLQNELRKYRQKNSGQRAGWIFGANYDDSLLAEKRHPTKADLDQVSADQPIIIFHASFHLIVANSKALALAGITAETPNPSGGVIQRLPGGTEPNGVLEELAMNPVMAIMPQSSLEELLGLLDEVQQQYAEWGITTAQDGATQKRDYELLSAAAEKGRLKLDILAYAFFTNIKDIMASNIEVGRDYNGLKLAGIKLLLDGSPQAKTAWLTKPYHKPPRGLDETYLGYPILPDEVVAGHVETAYARGWQIYAHCNGDAAADQFINAIGAAVARHGKSDRRTTIIHAQTLREDQLDRMVELGIIPSFFVTHTFYWGDWHRESVLGPERSERISPVRSAIDRGMRYTLHNDSPVAPSDCRMLLWSAVNRLTRSGQVLGEAQRITPLEALRGITIDAAYQHFEDAEKGSIETGKLADLVITADDPATMEVSALKDIEVVQTIKRGEVIYSRS